MTQNIVNKVKKEIVNQIDYLYNGEGLEIEDIITFLNEHDVYINDLPSPKNIKTLKDFGVYPEPQVSPAHGMCTIYERIDTRILKDTVIFAPIDKDGEHIVQLKLEMDMLRAIIHHAEGLEEI